MPIIPSGVSHDVYFLQGRPEDALSVEKAGIGRNEDNELPSKPIKLKYIHRDSDEGPEFIRSKDTSPWDIEAQLRTPQEAQNHPIQNKEVLIYYSSNTANGNNPVAYEEGIRKLRITMPMPDILAPPSTPALPDAEQRNVNNSRKSSILGEMYSHASMNGTYGVTRNVCQAPTLHYQTPVKIIHFKSNQAKSDSEKAKDAKRKSTKKATGPVPIGRSNATSKVVAQSKTSGRKKTRHYTHGQYLVKVDDSTIVKTRKIKMPKDLNNMLTKPYTFSYLTGVQAPCNLSSQLSKYSKHVANVSTTRHHNGDNHPQTTLVSEMRKVDDSISEQTHPKMQDACTQFDCEYVLDINDGAEVTNGCSGSTSNGDVETSHETPTDVSDSITSDLIKTASEENEQVILPPKDHMRVS